jgi:hypothetical protein
VARLTVEEASGAYAGAMRNVRPAGVGICATCKTFIDPQYSECLSCGRQPAWLDAVVPITYSEALGQMHLALRNYKDGVPQARAVAMPRLIGILWRFISIHERCVASAAGVPGFDVVTTVPSSTTVRDQRGHLRGLVEACVPLSDRYERVLYPTGEVPEGRDFDTRRYEANGRLDGASVLLIDDTWTSSLG